MPHPFLQPRLAKSLLLAAGFSAIWSNTSRAGAVTGTLLDQNGADQLETWLGVGDQDFTSIWYGTAGVSTAASFHAAADGAGPTVSIYDITLGDGSNALVGGYTAVDWESAGTYPDPTAFLFNLNTGEVQKTQDIPQSAVIVHPNFFPTFGSGHDLVAGWGILGTNYGAIGSANDGYSFSHSFDNQQGQITIAGDSGPGPGNSGYHYDHWSVNALEVFTFADAEIAPVPLPAGLPLLIGALGLTGLVARKRRQA